MNENAAAPPVGGRLNSNIVKDYTVHNNNVLVKYHNKKIRFLKGYNFVKIVNNKILTPSKRKV